MKAPCTGPVVLQPAAEYSGLSQQHHGSQDKKYD